MKMTARTGNVLPSELKDGVERLDLASVERWLQQPDRKLRDLRECLRRSHVVVRQWATSTERMQRDEFLSRTLAALTGADAEGAETAEMSRLVEGGRLFEVAYDELRTELEREIPSQEVRAGALWSLVALLGQTAAQIRVDAELMLRRGTIDPSASHAIGHGGLPYQPDTVWGSAVEVVTGGLQMLGHAGQYFDQDGALILPVRASGPLLSADPSQRLSYLGSIWMALERAEERWRWWGGVLEVIPQTTPDGRTIPCLRYAHDASRFEILNQIAIDRVPRLLLNAMLVAGDLARKLKISSQIDHDHLALPPAAWLSQAEFVASSCLEVLLKIDPATDQSEYDGLRLMEWLRGYSVLAELVQRRGEPVVTVGRDTLLKDLGRLGLSEEKAETFLRAVTFGRRSEDLFDCPILVSSDAQFHLLADVIRTWDLARILVSRVRTSKKSVKKKGPGLERFVLTRLAENGLEPKQIKFKVGREEYEFDVVFVWDDALFIFECKNRGLPGNAPRRLHELKTEMAEDLGQLERLVDAASAHRHELEQRLGRSWTRVVAAVLNGLPWACGAVGELAVFDASALLRFFQGGWALLECPPGATDEEAEAWKRSLGSVWAGTKPTAIDLEREIRDPFQLRALKDEWIVYQPIVPISEGLAFLRPVLTRKPPSLQRTLKALGVSDSDRLMLTTAYERASGRSLREPEDGLT